MATPRPAATPPCDSDPPCTETVEALWGMGTGPEDPDVLVGAEGSYDVDMATLMATVIAVGVILLFIHACFRLGLCCKHFACKGKPIQKKCCPCVEKKCCGRQALILKIALALVLVGVVLRRLPLAILAVGNLGLGERALLLGGLRLEALVTARHNRYVGH